MDKVAAINMGADSGVKAPCLQHLQKEAFQCLDTFPNKVMEINNIIDSFMPASVKIRNKNIKNLRKLHRSGSSVLPINEENFTIPETGVFSNYSYTSMCDNSSRKSIFKRRYYRGSKRYSLRRKPGPLGQILQFIVSNLAKCTKTLLIVPSSYVIGTVVSLLSLRNDKGDSDFELTEWKSALSVSPESSNEDNSVIKDFMKVIRPTIIQLIDDIKTLKRWLQALYISMSPDLPEILLKAIQITENVDSWAYELYFKLKLCPLKKKREFQQVAEMGIKINEELEFIRMWHRLVNLRNNYIILYDTLRHEKKFQELLEFKSSAE